MIDLGATRRLIVESLGNRGGPGKPSDRDSGFLLVHIVVRM
jgi:hypothetical protein